MIWNSENLFVQVILSQLEWVKCPFFINKKKMPFCGEFPFTMNHKMFSLYGLSYNILNQQQSAGLRQSPSGFFFLFHTPVKYFKVLIYMKWIPVYLQNAVLSSVSSASISMCLIPPKS